MKTSTYSFFRAIHLTIGIAFLLGGSLSSSAQVNQNIRTGSLVFTGAMDLEKDQLTLQQRPAMADGLVNEAELRLDGGDLYLRFQLKRPRADQSYLTDLQIYFDDKPVQPAPGRLLGQQTGEKEELARQIILLDVHELVNSVTAQVRVQLQITLVREIIDCEAGPPSFSGAQQWPYYAIAALGAGMIATGQLLTKDAEDTYQTDYLSQTSAETAGPILEDLNQKNQTGVILTYAGAAVLIGDAVWYLVRRSKFVRQRQLYREYCGDLSGFQLKPEWQVGRVSAVGFRMTYTF